MRLQLRRDASERGTRHRGRDGRHPRFMPADAGIDDGRAGGLHGLRLGDDVVPTVAALDQVEHRQPVDDDEIRAAGLAHAAHDLHRETHPPGRIAAPGVITAVGARRSELVEQVAFRAHDLHAVVAGLAGQAGGGSEIADMALDPSCRERPWGEGIDRRLQLRRRHRQRVVGVPPGMQQLHADLAVVGMHRRGDLPVPCDMPGHRHPARERLQPADQVGREPTRHDQPGSAGRTFGEIRGQFREIRRAVFKAGVHGSHQHPVAQAGKAQVEGLEQVRVGRTGHRASIPMRTVMCMASIGLLHRSVWGDCHLQAATAPYVTIRRARFACRPRQSGGDAGSACRQASSALQPASVLHRDNCYASVNTAFTWPPLLCTRDGVRTQPSEAHNLASLVSITDQGAEHE